MDRREIARTLEEIATLLELKGENAFKVRAYQNGARTVETLEEDLETLIAEERLDEVKGIGKALAEKIAALSREGRLPLHDKLRAETPEGLLVMMEIPGLGAKKIKKLHDELQIETLEQLKEAAQDGRIAGLAGFGKKSAEKILEGIRNREAYSARHHWWTAAESVAPLLEALRKRPEVERAEAAGSFRRLRETVGDLDFIAASSNPGPLMDWFTGREEVAEVTAKGETKASVRFGSGLQADLRVVPPDQYVFALHHFTGSKEHNVKMRSRALDRGFSLSEWGLVPKDRKQTRENAVDGITTEKELFAYLHLNYIPPELREGRDELEWAETQEAPELIRVGDLRGAFHNHTNASDGAHTLEQMAAMADELGWDYLGIADHSVSSWQANGLDEKRVRQQLAKIRELNESGDYKVHLYAGVECDIRGDGALDFDDDLLRDLDYVVASVHSQFNLSEADMTKRFLKAIENPYVTIIGHLTGRILLRREPYAVDVNKVIDAAAANGTSIEINASPWRLDMDWRHWFRAREKGVVATINPDAHEREGLRHVLAGVNVARKAGLTKAEVLNTRSRTEVTKWFRQARGGSA